MQLKEIQVLLVEDNPADARLLHEMIREAEGSHIHVTHVDTLGKAISKLAQLQFDVVMLDLSLPDAEGLNTLVKTHAHAPSVPIVVLTGLDDEDLAIRAVREGAQDYLVKGQVTSQLIVRAMRYATERKRAIEALQRSEEYFRSLIENALDIITVLDNDGNIRYGSPSFERTLGYPQAALTGTAAYDLVHPDDRHRLSEMLIKGTENPGATQHFEMRLRHRNGTWRTMEAIGKRFEGESQVDGYVLNSRDITERKRSEEQLRKANDTLRAVIEASPLAIYSLDLDGNVRSWNSAAETMFGYSQSEVNYGQLPTVLPEDEASFRQRLQDAANGNLAFGIEQRAHTRDGKIIDVSVWNATLRDESGVVEAIVEAVADTTERKRLEEQFRQAQKMEAVGRLAGGVAHDFNNLLTVITGYCQMLLDQLNAGQNPTPGDIEQIMKAANRATALTRQLLAFSRRQLVQPRIVDAAALVSDMMPMLGKLVGETVKVTLSIEGADQRVRVDPGNLEQVIVNLVANARDAMHSAGEIRIRLHNEVATSESGNPYRMLPPGPYVVIDVTDNGAGMTDEVISHLFEPFFTTKEKGRGTGLGLSTSYGIVKQNRGEILVRSRLGEGSTFSVCLPLVAEPCDQPKPAPKGRADFTGAETILLAEDEDGVRKVVTEMLRKQGYTVLAAVNGSHALEVARRSERPVDLLITDVVMPGMNGRELADQLRVESPTTKVLFVSGYTESGIVSQGEIDAGTAFLHKPFSNEDLARKVREVLEAKEPSPANVG